MHSKLPWPIMSYGFSLLGDDKIEKGRARDAWRSAIDAASSPWAVCAFWGMYD